ncbi:MAG: transposase [Bacteroidales bacterium]|nr:transposase [Bacteroidales bacterium]
MREQLEGFLGIFSPRFPKPTMRFIGQMLYGIQAAQDVKLSQIGRELCEPIPIGKVENRLSRNLAREGMADVLHDCILDHVAPTIGKDTLIILDPSDIQKDYAKKMPYLAKVWDGSEGKVGANLGYNGCMAVSCEAGPHRMTPLAFRLWSCEAPGFKSENAEVEAVVDAIAKKAGGNGIYVYDRGGDRIGLFNHFMDGELRFIVRLIGNRNLVWRRKVRLAGKLAGKCRMKYRTHVTFLSHGRERNVQIEFGVMDVGLPGRPGAALRLVVVRGFGNDPMLLLTNLAATDSFKSLWQVVGGYISRWRVEETIRFIKQSYRLEDMRLLNYERLKNMAALVLCASAFAASWMGLGERLEILVSHVVDMSKRIHQVPEFFYYALADGIRRLFTRYGNGWGRKTPDVPSHDDDRQLLLPLCFTPG